MIAITQRASRFAKAGDEKSGEVVGVGGQWPGDVAARVVIVLVPETDSMEHSALHRLNPRGCKRTAESTGHLLIAIILCTDYIPLPQGIEDLPLVNSAKKQKEEEHHFWPSESSTAM